MLKKPVAWTVAFVVFAGGCIHFEHGDVVAEYQPGEPAITAQADYTATYSLWERLTDSSTRQRTNGASTDSEGAKTKVRDVSLTCGDEIGFQNGENGQIVAVAGGEKIPLDDGHYFWQEAEPHGGKLMFNVASIIVGLPITIPMVVTIWPIMIVGDLASGLIHSDPPAKPPMPGEGEEGRSSEISP
jgi:hypothetical protein